MHEFRRGLYHGIPIGLGYLSVSFSFGVNAVNGGLTVLQALLVSMTNMTSAGQLAGLELMIGLAPYFEMFLVQLTINIRYALMSMSLSQKLDASMTTAHRLGTAFFVTDEVFAVGVSSRGLLNKAYLYGLGSAPYLGWALGTWLGAVAGSILPDGVTAALGIMIYGMFIAIVVPPAKKQKPVRFVVIVAALLSVLIHYAPWFGGISGGGSIILCALIAAGLGAWLFPISQEEA